ncbi:hypothetical protein J1N35_007086 [Gossypium stocksii]|uniref:Reverse transcriptase zinc-binding domain-containing protein n=1 Tax=Gossypium stocksii TaxID=47602 RepID=A0A9D3W6T6_9ROSI|nr:hypothetical protein J1N35_007086 [Gossypium stocksii]
MVGKMQERLVGWKAHSLSLAGRIMLAKPVLSSMPIYAMQKSVIPSSVSLEMERIINHSDQKRGVNWKQVCTAPEEGGLEFRSSMVNRVGEWNWNRFVDIIPTGDLRRIAATLPCKMDVEDTPRWLWDGKCRFTIKPSLQIAAATGEADIWRKLCKCWGHERVRMFLWLVCNDKLLMNEEHLKRKMTTEVNCSFCIIGHVLRSCPLALSLWTSLVHPT